MKKTWKVSVIGCGMFANNQYLPHIELEANAKCVAVVDVVEERAIEYAEKFNVPNWYKSVDELIEKCDFDIAIDVASIQAHHEINMKILGAGKHLISQKPAAPTVEMLTEQIELAKKNAELVLSTDKERLKREEGRTIGAVKELEKLLELKGIVRMEAFDISNINGFENVGSMVVYEKGKPKKSDYRKFKIKSVSLVNSIRPFL
mgnify:CR=1 FL=1